MFEFEGELFLVLHLMIAGRLRWREPGREVAGRGALCALRLSRRTLLFTEASTKKRASLHLVRGAAALAALDRAASRR